MNPDRVVYVVDDDDAVRNAVRLLFRTADLEVETFPSAAAFLAQMDGDPVGTPAFRCQRGGDDVRIRGAPRLAKRGHVVDVHTRNLGGNSIVADRVVVVRDVNSLR